MYIILLCFFSFLFSQNSCPIILIHGFLGWGRDELPNYYYWGGKIDLEQMLKDAGIEVINNPYKRKISQTEIIPLLEGVGGVIAGLEQYDKDVLSRSELKVISRCGSGLSNIDLDAAKKLNIAVYSTPDGPTQSVAELTIGCLLSLIRNVPHVNNLMHAGKWEKTTGHLLKDMNVLLIGYGRIGKTVARILDAIGANIFVYDPFVSENNIPDHFTKIDLTNGIKIADVITLHSSGEELILGEKEFYLMRLIGLHIG